jgi:DNA-binding MarR family transcriptional regulator
MNADHETELDEIASAELEAFGYELHGDALVRATERVAHAMRRDLEKAIDSVPGGMGAWWVLHHLDRYGREAQVDMARDFGVASSALTQRLKHLEEAGLITRTPDEHDPRRMMIALSEQGAVMYREQQECANVEVDRLTAGAECWDIDVFRRVMRVIQENLHKPNTDDSAQASRGGSSGAGET